MITRLILYIKKNLRSFVLGSFLLAVSVSFYNLFQISYTSSYITQDDTSLLSDTITPEIDSNTLKILDYRYLKRMAMDSLIDNNILTPENIAKIDSLYPDSLCKCGNYLDLDTLIR